MLKFHARSLTTLFLTAVCLGSLAVAARAQEQPLEPGQQTMQSLKKMLEDVGYEHQQLKLEGMAAAPYMVQVPSSVPNWKIKILVNISPNQDTLWLWALLGKAPDANNVPHDILTNMLKLNDNMGTCYFALDKSGTFVLYQPNTNRGITPKLLKTQLDQLARVTSQQERVWNPKLWATQPGTGPSPAPVISPEVQKLIASLSSPDEFQRMKAAKDLAKMGPAASAAIPALQKLLQDPDEDVRGVVANAIDRIRKGPAPTPGPVPAPANTVAGTTWDGTESLWGNSKLNFQFKADGSAVMIDASSTVGGTWTQKNDQVTVTFGNCVYTGTVKGQVLSGTARFTTAEPREWTFTLTRVTTTALHAGPGKVEGELGPNALRFFTEREPLRNDRR